MCDVRSINMHADAQIHMHAHHHIHVNFKDAHAQNKQKKHIIRAIFNVRLND